jgi:phosphopantetheinyl transferase
VSEVHLACGRVAALLEDAPQPAGWLSAQEAGRLATMRTPVRRDQFLAARWQARCLLARVAGGHPAQWALDAPEDAPPAVLADPAWHVSVSHSGDEVAVALSRRPVGIDLEVPRRARDIEGLVALCCTEAERRLFAPEEGANVLFHELWTVKESWLKCRREGVAPARLQQLDAARDARGEVRTWAGAGRWLALCADSASEPRWWSEAPPARGAWRVRDLRPA